jgi:hypothetical protein
VLYCYTKISQVEGALMSTLTINDVYGVSTYVSNEAIRIKFRCPLPLESWHVLLKSIQDLVEQGQVNWEFDFTELEHPCSTDIGMWVTCSARIKLKSGNLLYTVRKGSSVHMLLEFTRLIEILNISIVK